jgi:hypothetical protein
MARDPVLVGDREFETKTAAYREVQEMMGRYRTGVVHLSGADLDFAMAILDLHPQRDEILAEGCKGIVVKKAEGYSTRCLAVEQNTGDMQEFSAQVALKRQPCKPLLSAAARNAVSGRVREFKVDAFKLPPVRCATSGVELSFDEAHVDHAQPWTFKKIVEAFHRENPEVKIRHGGTQDLFENDADAAKFINFHDAKADLQIVHRTENLSTLQRERNASDKVNVAPSGIDLSEMVAVGKAFP